MPPTKYVVCVTTTKPSATVTPNGGGGALAIVCPDTGAALSSLRTTADLSGRAAMGMSSVSAFPQDFSSSNTQLVVSYGGNSAKKGDTYAMLASIRSASSAPILHWKCRIPESELTAGLIVSPCGNYIIGGGASGSCFVWASIGGDLLKVFKAHYRPVSSILFSQCGRYVITGGADGMIHLFSLMDLVDKGSRKSKRNVTPLNTWPCHHFPIKCMALMDNGRVASGAEDGQIIIVELFSKEVVARIKLPTSIESLTHHDSRIYAGTRSGTIFAIDLDSYAIHLTEKQGGTLTRKQKMEKQKFLAAEEKVFGKKVSDENNNRTYETEWIGHEHPVSAIAFLHEGEHERLISGDQSGEIRIWDSMSRTCLKVIQPWSQTTAEFVPRSDSKSTSSSSKHPVTSIMIIPEPQESSASSMFATSGGQKGQISIATLVTPLQKYMQEQDTNGPNYMAIPFLKPNRSEENLSFWRARTVHRKRKAQEATETPEIVLKLQKQVEEKQAEIARWEEVNNKLMKKLKSKKT